MGPGPGLGTGLYPGPGPGLGTGLYPGPGLDEHAGPVPRFSLLSPAVISQLLYLGRQEGVDDEDKRLRVLPQVQLLLPGLKVEQDLKPDLV